jgi:hypothetical protein
LLQLEYVGIDYFVVPNANASCLTNIWVEYWSDKSAVLKTAIYPFLVHTAPITVYTAAMKMKDNNRFQSHDNPIATRVN